MDLECSSKDCEQICEAKECKLNCSGEKCKTQKCEGEGKACEMDLKCDGEDQDCKQTCNVDKCNLKRSGKKCKEQNFTGNVQVYDMHCNANVCTKTCYGTCNITRTMPTSCHNKLICSGDVECCGGPVPPSITRSLTAEIFHIDCSAGKSCKCTKCSESHCITSDSYTSSIVSSSGASTIQVFATKLPTGHGIEAYSEYNDKLNA